MRALTNVKIRYVVNITNIIYYTHLILVFLQLRNCRASQNQLELDLKNKESALGIDMMCHQLNNYSHGLQYYNGIEKYDPW